MKGPGGGYRLLRDARDIRVRDVVEALEGPMALAPCVGYGEGAACPRAEHCATRQLWQQLSRAVSEWLDGYTLQDLLDRDGEPAGGRVAPGPGLEP